MSAYIVLVPTRHPRLFLATFCARDGSATWCAEYPNAHVFSRLRLAMCAAQRHRGMVYDADAYGRGDGPLESFI